MHLFQNSKAEKVSSRCACARVHILDYPPLLQALPMRAQDVNTDLTDHTKLVCQSFSERLLQSLLQSVPFYPPKLRHCLTSSLFTGTFLKLDAQALAIQML